MSYFYTLAPSTTPPEALALRFPNPETLDNWNRYGSYCVDTTPAYIVTFEEIPAFNVDITEIQVIKIDPRSELSAALQTLQAIGSYLFNPEAVKPIVMSQEIGDALYHYPVYRLIHFNYEDTREGKQQLEADCIAATGINLDLRKSLETLKQEAWSAVKATLTTGA